MVFLCAGFFSIASATNDSTSITTSPVNTQTKVTVSVTHYAMGGGSLTTQCPSNGTLRSSTSGKALYSFSPTSASWQNYVYFTCEETYYTSDAFYQTLRNNIAPYCSQNTSYYTDTSPNGGEMCSLQHPPLNVVTLIFRVPTAITIYRSESNAARLQNLRVWINGSIAYDSGSGLQPLTFSTQAFTGSDPFITFPASYSFSWALQGPYLLDDPIGSSAFDLHDTWGTYTCGTNTGANVSPGFFTFNFSEQFVGKTCTFTCSGPWYFYSGNPWDHWWNNSGYAACK